MAAIEHLTLLNLREKFQYIAQLIPGGKCLQQGDIPVATMTLYFSHNLAGLLDLSVLPAKRKKGYGSEMFNRSLHLAKTKGLKTCVLEASEDGLHIYERAGFKFQEEFRIWNLQSL